VNFIFALVYRLDFESATERARGIRVHVHASLLLNLANYVRFVERLCVGEI
jgi:hypothetical protein